MMHKRINEVEDKIVSVVAIVSVDLVRGIMYVFDLFNYLKVYFLFVIYLYLFVFCRDGLCTNTERLPPFPGSVSAQQLTLSRLLLVPLTC